MNTAAGVYTAVSWSYNTLSTPGVYTAVSGAITPYLLLASTLLGPVVNTFSTSGADTAMAGTWSYNTLSTLGTYTDSSRSCCISTPYSVQMSTPHTLM